MMTINTLIQDLKENLKAMIIGFIKEHKDEDTYEYRILSKFEYLTSATFYNIFKVVDKLGKVKYYQGFERRREVSPLKDAEVAINNLKDGTILSWKQLNALFDGCMRKEFTHSNMGKEWYYQDREYHNIYPSLEDHDFLDEILSQVIYKLDGSHIIRNLVRLDKVIGCTLSGFTFSGLEKDEEVPIKVLVFIPNEENRLCSLLFGISPDYINDVFVQIKTKRRYYKDEGYYQNKKIASYTLQINAMRISKDEVEMEEACYLSDEFADRLFDFIHDNNTHIFRIETPQQKNKEQIDQEMAWLFKKDPEWYDKETMYAVINSRYDDYAKGLKIYKIPRAPFDWTYRLERIKAKVAQFEAAKVNLARIDIEEYILFTKYDISFEYAPDNYLEIYGTQEALDLFFLKHPTTDLVRFELLRIMFNEKEVYILDHFYPQTAAGGCAAI